MSPVIVGAAEASPHPTKPLAASILTIKLSECSYLCPPPITIGLVRGIATGIASTRRIIKGSALSRARFDFDVFIDSWLFDLKTDSRLPELTIILQALTGGAVRLYCCALHFRFALPIYTLPS